MSWDHKLCNWRLCVWFEPKFIRMALDKFGERALSHFGFLEAGGAQESVYPVGGVLADTGLEFGVVPIHIGIGGL